MSSDDADDERETPAATPLPWIDSRRLTFTIFVVLPNDNVCTLRDIPSGMAAFDLKVRCRVIRLFERLLSASHFPFPISSFLGPGFHVALKHGLLFFLLPNILPLP